MINFWKRRLLQEIRVDVDRIRKPLDQECVGGIHLHYAYKGRDSALVLLVLGIMVPPRIQRLDKIAGKLM